MRINIVHIWTALLQWGQRIMSADNTFGSIFEHIIQ